MTAVEQEARRWLAAAAVPGRTLLRLAAACQVLETVFTVVQWTALAWIAQDALSRPTQPAWPALGVLFAGGLLAGGAAWSAAAFQATGGQRIAHAIRQRLVAALLPSRLRHDEPDAAMAALASIELTDDIAVVVLAMHELPPDPGALGCAWSTVSLD
jgi:ATP-binding cassette subfamily C protein CydD